MPITRMVEKSKGGTQKVHDSASRRFLEQRRGPRSPVLANPHAKEGLPTACDEAFQAVRDDMEKDKKQRVETVGGLRK